MAMVQEIYIYYAGSIAYDGCNIEEESEYPVCGRVGIMGLLGWDDSEYGGEELSGHGYLFSRDGEAVMPTPQIVMMKLVPILM